MRKIWLFLVAFLIVAGITLFLGADFFTELMWYKNLGYLQSFWTLLKLKVVPGIIAFLIIFFFLSVNWLYVQKSWEKIRIREGEEPIRVPRWLIFIVAFIVAVAFNSNIFLRWQDVAGFLGRNPVGLSDPIFNLDISFYLFSLPIIESVYQTVFGMFMFTLIAALIFYLVTGSIRFSNRYLNIKSEARFHLLILILLVTALGIVGYMIKGYQLLNSPTGLIYGAGYSDVYGKIIVYRVLQVLSGLTVLVCVFDLFKNSYRPTLFFLLLLLSVGFLGQFVPGIIQAYVVEPNELAKEKSFIENNIRFTRYAFNLDKIKSSQFDPALSFSNDDWLDNDGVVRNIRLWDWRALEKSFAELQELRSYYSIGEIDIDRYVIGDEVRQVAIATREINPNKLAENANSWVNRHLVFTHGYGVVVSSMHDVTEQGLPELWVKDIPPKGILSITRPEIYFGEKTDDYVIVNTRQKELDYPSGEENVFTSYQGEGGIMIGNPLQKLIYALRFRNTKILLSKDIKSDSRIMYYRNVKERVRKLAPFLRLDPDPYAVIADGSIFWILDAYTTSNRFPYSTPQKEYGNYMRGSFKVIVDAYSGMVDIYLYDEDDPIGRGYQKVFPTLIKDKEQFPKELIPHLRYPEQMFLAQARTLESYHMTNPEIFFNKEDVWEFPKELYQSDTVYMEPYYTMVRFPDEDDAEFVLMLPFTPKNKHNMVSWLSGRSDPKNYGELVLYRFPKDRIIYGPMQIEARINQDPEISKLLSLWNQQGSSVKRGNHLVLPMNDSLLYVEPIYLQSNQGQIPEIRLVILSDGTNLVYGATFQEAFELLAGEVIKKSPAFVNNEEDIVETRVVDLVNLAWEAFLEAERALQAGPNWEDYGKAQQKLKELLEILNSADI